MPDRTYMDYVSPLLAVDAKNLTDIIRKLMRPGIISTDADCCKATVDAVNKKVTFAALAAGDAVFTNYSCCEEYYETEVVFTVADATGSYRIYLDAYDPGNSPNVLVEYQLWPRKTQAAIDTDRYIWVCTVTWDSATLTLTMGFQQPRPFGVFELGQIGRGDANEAAIRSGETLSIESGGDLVGENGSTATFDYAVISDLLEFLDNTDVVSGANFHWDFQGDSELDAAAVALQLLMGDNSSIQMGSMSSIAMDTNTTMITGADFLLSMAADGEISMGQDPLLTLGNGLIMTCADDADVDWGNDLAMDFGDDSDLQIGVGSVLRFLNGLFLKAYSSGTPEQYELSRSNIVTAWVRYDGVTQTVLASYNVSSVTYNSQGNYTVNFDRNYTAFNYAPVACLNDLTSPVADESGDANTCNEAAGTCDVYTTHNTALVNRMWTLIVVGGTQV